MFDRSAWRGMAILLLLIVMMVLTIRGALADEQLIITYGGDDEMQVTPLYRYLVGSEGILKKYSGGSNAAGFEPKYYDVIVDVQRKTYSPGELVKAVVKIDYQGVHPPPQDGILEYVVVNNLGYTLRPAKQTVAEGDHNITLGYALPRDSEKGQYTFKVRWIVPDLEPIEATDVFHVEIRWILIVLAVFIVLSVAVFGYYWMSKRNEGDDDG